MAGLRVDITGDGSGLSRALNKSQGEVRQWASGVKNQIMGAFSAAAITAAFKATISNMQSVGDSAQRLDVPIEQLETLQNIALLAGRDLSKVEMILNRIGDAKSEALAGDEKKLDLFKQMGIGFGELSQLNDVKLWERMSIGTSQMNMSQKRNVLTDVVGKQGVGTFNSMQEDMNGFTGTMKRWLENNTILEQDTILSHKQSADELDVAMKQLANSVLKDLIPALATFNKAMVGIVNLMWAIDQFRPLKMGSVLNSFNSWITGLRDTFKPKMEPVAVPPLHVDGDSISTLPASADKSKFDMNAWKRVDKKPKDIYSDSLLGIGNFMGQGFRGISDVTTMMDETRKHTKLMENTNMKLDKLNTTMEKYLTKNPFSVLP